MSAIGTDSSSGEFGVCGLMSIEKDAERFRAGEIVGQAHRLPALNWQAKRLPYK